MREYFSFLPRAYILFYLLLGNIAFGLITVLALLYFSDGNDFVSFIVLMVIMLFRSMLGLYFDDFILSGLTAKTSSKLEFFKTAFSGNDFMKKVILGDMIQRIIGNAIIVICGISFTKGFAFPVMIMAFALVMIENVVLIILRKSHYLLYRVLILYLENMLLGLILLGVVLLFSVIESVLIWIISLILFASLTAVIDYIIFRYMNNCFIRSYRDGEE